MVKIGLIGCGFMGGMHLSCYNALREGVRVTAIADINEERTSGFSKKFDLEVYKSGEELIKNADVDAIDICLPTYLHTQHAVMAMEHGRDVFIEKPVCLNLDEAALLLETQKKTGKRVMVGQVIRSWDEYKFLKKIVDENTYGKVVSAVFKRLSPLPTWSWEGWLHKPECSGTMALDLHIHDVDYMRYLLGEPQDLSSHVARDENGILNHIFSTFLYDGFVVTVEGCWDYPKDFPFSMEYRVMFEDATVMFNSHHQSPVIYLKEGGIIKPEIERVFEDSGDLGGNISSLGGYYNELKYFVQKLASGAEIEIAPLSEGVKSVELVLREIELAGGAVKK